MKTFARAALFSTMLAIAAAPASAAVISSFSDNFEADGPQTLNYNAFLNWNVTLGSVDLITSGGWGVACPGGSGNCVDLDGSSHAAGTIMTKDTFAPGTYTLSFVISGNQRGTPDDVLSVSLGSYTETFTRAFTDAFETIIRTVTVTDPTSLVFAHLGGDNQGIILDNVSVSAAAVVGETPIPGALPLFASGLGALGLVAWRRKRRTPASA